MKYLRPFLAVVAILALPFGMAHASYPEKAVKIVVNSAPGGGADTLARMLADALSRELGQPAIVENKPGAGGNLAGNAVVGAAADGYTLLMADSGMLVINPSLYKSMPFNPATDFNLVALVAEFPIVIAAHPGSGIDSIAKLVEKAKANPETINYASTGIGSPQHLTAALLQSETGIKLVHIPYKGGAPALVDLISGRVPVGFIGIPPTAPRVTGGELLGLAVTTKERSPLLPNVPTVSETIPGFTTSVWFGLLAPKKLPAEVADTLNAAVRKVMTTDDMKKKLGGLGYSVMSGTVADIQAYMARESERWAKAVKESGAKVE